MGGRRVDDSSRLDWRAAQARKLAARYDAVRPLLGEFLDNVLGAPWAIIGPASRLSDFASLVPPDTMRDRIKARYGVAIEGLPDDLVVTVLEAVAANRRKRP